MDCLYSLPSESGPNRPETLTDDFDDETISFRQELQDERWTEEAISRAIEEVRARIESKKAPPDFEGIKKAL